MSSTYSINNGTITESDRRSDINSVLSNLQDNTQKLINPKDIRDAFLSTWSNSSFKQTINSAQIEYIGIDSGDPLNRDIKQKIFLGKRNYKGGDIMTNSLLSSDTDIFIYNTKSDTALYQDQTKITILAGTNSALYSGAPYIKSYTSASYIGLDLVNPSTYSGPINIYSESGRVSINGISFPSVLENTASASNGKILKYYGDYPHGNFVWDLPTLTNDFIGGTGSITNIYGSTVSLNGYLLEFIDNNIAPQTIGGINIGSSFSRGSFNGQNWPLSEVLRKLLYPYVPPTLTLNITDQVADSGLTSSFTFFHTIRRNSNNITLYNITGTTYSGSYIAPVGSLTSSSFLYSISSLTSSYTASYVLRASDTGSLSLSHSATASIRFISPFFKSFNSTLTDINSSSSVGTLINNSSKILTEYIGNSQSIDVNFIGSGYIYFLVPGISLLSKIKDPNGFIIHNSSSPSSSSFTYSNSMITPTGISLSVNAFNNYGQYRVYRTTSTCSYSGGGEFQFIF